MNNNQFKKALKEFLKDPASMTDGLLLSALCLTEKVHGALDHEKHGGDEVSAALKEVFKDIKIPKEQLKELYWLSEALVGFCLSKTLTPEQQIESGALGKFFGELVSVVNPEFSENDVSEVSKERKKAIQDSFYQLEQQKTKFINAYQPEFKVDSQFRLTVPSVENMLKHAWQTILNEKIVRESTQKTQKILNKTDLKTVSEEHLKPTFK